MKLKHMIFIVSDTFVELGAFFVISFSFSIYLLTFY